MDTVELIAPYPNPASQFAEFSLVLEEPDYVRIAVYDVLGRQVQLINEATLGPDERHTFMFDGSSLASGVYFIRVSADRFVATESIVLLP